MIFCKESLLGDKRLSRHESSGVLGNFILKHVVQWAGGLNQTLDPPESHGQPNQGLHFSFLVPEPRIVLGIQQVLPKGNDKHH